MFEGAAAIGRVAKLYEEAKTFGVGLSNGPQPILKPSEADAAEFGSFVKGLVTDSVNVLRRSEAVSVAGAQGKASAQQVVEGVMAAEVTLQSAVAIRDKLVSSYQEIMRMPI
ncbi:MAG: flagellar hook-basal body complex protein FliE [Parvibaculum sp.]